MLDEPLYVLAVLCLAIAVSEGLVRHTPLKHLGTALLVIVVVAVLANVGVVPVYSSEVAVYGGIFDYGIYTGVFWLLLRVRLADVKRAGARMLALFAIGAVGTTLGVVAGLAIVGGEAAFGEHAPALGGMFVATYTGGSANLNIVAVEYGVAKDGLLYTGANAVDAILTTVWMAASIALPRVLQARFPRDVTRVEGPDDASEVVATGNDDEESIDPLDLGLLLALGGGAYVGSRLATDALNDALASLGLDATVPFAIVITSVALLLAQVPAVARLRGTRLLGIFATYLFLAVIGALCDLSALDRLGELAGNLWVFAATVISVHGLVVFGVAGLLRFDWSMAAVASQSCVGGGTSALALARSLGRSDLVLPAILLGALGTAAGTYLGFFVAGTVLGAG